MWSEVMVLGNTVADLFILGELCCSYLFSNQRKRGNCDNLSSCVAIHNIRSYLSPIGIYFETILFDPIFE